MKYLKKFNEEFGRSSNYDDDEFINPDLEAIAAFNAMTLSDKIKYLVFNFGMDQIEAEEICDDNENITVDDLPDEIRFTFYDGEEGEVPVEDDDEEEFPQLEEGKTYRDTKKFFGKKEWEPDKKDSFRSKVKDHIKSQNMKAVQVGNDFEIRSKLEDKKVGIAMFRDDYIGVKKEGTKFVDEFKYTELGKIKSAITKIIKAYKDED